VTAYEIPATGSAEVHVLHWAVYEGDRWIDRDADGVPLSPSVRLLRTPGHTGEDISTVAVTADGFATVIVPGHGAPFRPGSLP
jgi:hypothetical protein